MILSLQSNPSDYSRLKANINIPWKCHYVNYYVSTVNTKANILITTTDDYIKFANKIGEYKESNNVVKDLHENIINFDNKWYYTDNDILDVFKCQNIFTAEFNELRTLTFKTNFEEVIINDMSHRAKLITGLYNTKFPITFSKTNEFVVNDIPIVDYANKLYLVSLQGQAVFSSKEGNEYTPSVLTSLDCFIKYGKPILVEYYDKKPIKIKINTDGLKYLEMQLVDFQYYPVPIKNPIFVIVKVKPQLTTPTSKNI